MKVFMSVLPWWFKLCPGLLCLFLVFPAFSPLYAAGAVSGTGGCRVNGMKQPVKQEDALAFYFKANQLNKALDYEHAISCYKSAIDAGMRTGDIYYNLAGSYFRNAELGYAVLNYKRAYRYMPWDQDLAYNMQYVLSMTKDKAENDRGLASMFLLSDINSRTLFYIWAIANFIFWMSLLIRRYSFIRWVALAVLIILSPGVFLRERLDFNRAVVVAGGELPVRSSPEPGGTDLFIIHEGLSVTITDEAGGWRKISVGRDKRGWVEKTALEKIVAF